MQKYEKKSLKFHMQIAKNLYFRQKITKLPFFNMKWIRVEI